MQLGKISRAHAGVRCLSRGGKQTRAILRSARGESTYILAAHSCLSPIDLIKSVTTDSHCSILASKERRDWNSVPNLSGSNGRHVENWEIIRLCRSATWLSQFDVRVVAFELVYVELVQS